MTVDRPKVVIITGASQGIGAALVDAHRGLDYAVVANSRSIAPGDDPSLAAVAGDVADPATADRIVSTRNRAIRGGRHADQRRRRVRLQTVHRGGPSQDANGGRDPRQRK